MRKEGRKFNWKLLNAAKMPKNEPQGVATLFFSRFSVGRLPRTSERPGASSGLFSAIPPGPGKMAGITCRRVPKLSYYEFP
jgi:hypothetical protein